jgi:dTDP-4-amino-4,6-dideoxygalactose transaminase
VQVKGKLALHGGSPAAAGKKSPWPLWDGTQDEQPVLAALRSGVWSRAERVAKFEEKYASLIGTKRCLATTNGTMALVTALTALEVGVGDEVLVGPYTFIASVNAIFAAGALPIFVDTDPETFLVNPELMEAKITPNTRAILPVHINGLPADMGRINTIAKKHDLVVVEDACQAWMSELNGQKCGSLGDLGCFSFQNSKNFTCGEGGAVTGNDDAVMDRAYSFHNFGIAYNEPAPRKGQAVRLGMKCRMSEYQAAILMAQMMRLEEQSECRWENAQRVSARLREIPGITPARLNAGVTCVSYYKYPFRFQCEQFGGVTRENFIRAMRAEGVSCSAGRRVALNRQPFFEEVLSSRNFQRMYSKEQLEHCRQQNHCPGNDKLCGEAVSFSQSLLLGSKEGTDKIADAFEKVYEHRSELA